MWNRLIDTAREYLALLRLQYMTGPTSWWSGSLRITEQNRSSPRTVIPSPGRTVTYRSALRCEANPVETDTANRRPRSRRPLQTYGSSELPPFPRSLTHDLDTSPS